MLKSFRQFNESKLFGQSDLYEEINQGRYQLLMSKHVKMTQSEVEQIKDELESFGITATDLIQGVEHRHFIRGNYNGRVRIVITKIEDDYFLLRLPDEERYFKCDTIEGLFEIIEIYLN
jgi:hypothetical protein